MYASKQLPVVFRKKKLKLCFYIWKRITWPGIFESTFPSKTLTLERQLSYLKWFATMCLTVERFEHNALLPDFPGAVSSLNLFESPSFLEGIWFFFLWFLNHGVFDKFIQFRGCVKSASYYFYCFNGDHVWQCVKRACDSVLFIFSKKTYLKEFSTLGGQTPPCPLAPEGLVLGLIIRTGKLH